MSRKRNRRRDFVYPAGPPPRRPGGGRARPPAARPWTSPRDLATGMLESALLAGFWAVMLVIGVGVPLLGAMEGLYRAGYTARNPLAPEMVSTFGWSLLWAALGLTLLGRVWRQAGGSIVLLLITWFGTAFFLPLILSMLVMLPVQAVVSPVFGVDATHWRPLLHTALAVLGAIWGIWIVADSAPDGYHAGAAGYRPSSGGLGPRADVMGTATHAVSKSPDDGWSDGSNDSGGSGGGDSD